MSPLNERDMSFLALLALSEVKAGRKLTRAEASPLLGKLRNENAKRVAEFFIENGHRVDRPSTYKEAATKLQLWAARNREVHGRSEAAGASG